MFMICHRIGLPPISTIGLGRKAVSSERRVPNPPAKITTFIGSLLLRCRTPMSSMLHTTQPCNDGVMIKPFPSRQLALDVLAVPGGHCLHDSINLLGGDVRIERQRHQT